MDEIKRIRSLSETAAKAGRVLLGVSFDIANAFNTLPWWVIRGALEYHDVRPPVFDRHDPRLPPGQEIGLHG